ncbi:hypothetical protein [Streptomyces massasporeus]|uniref:hypothetical protein n=1 Tax=Streptomyces massasporeus TaxID=67324 RepID=UPI00381BB3EF
MSRSPGAPASGTPPADCSTLLNDYLDQQLRRNAAMTHADYSLPARLFVAPGHALGMSLLAEQLKFTRSRLTRAVIRLEESGYARRREDPADDAESWPNSPMPKWS